MLNEQGPESHVEEYDMRMRTIRSGTSSFSSLQFRCPPAHHCDRSLPRMTFLTQLNDTRPYRSKINPNKFEIGRLLVKIIGRMRNAAVISSVLLAVPGCAALPRTQYSASEAATSHVLDVNGLRRYTDEPVSKFEVAKSNPAATTYLALSGRGAMGLTGWES
jgi:hypothetical protein